MLCLPGGHSGLPFVVMKTTYNVLATLLGLWISGLSAYGGDENYDPNKFFTKQILPILKAQCFKCHSNEHEVKGGLSLDTKAGWEIGGEAGQAVKPNDLKNSLLIQAIRHGDPDTAMPPKKKLQPVEIALLEAWVMLGAPDPR